MKHMKLLSLSSGIAATVLGFSGPVWALQPLQEFLAGARSQSFAAREQNVNVQVREAEEEVAFGRLLPSLTARGTYSYNQYEAKVSAPGVGEIVITPHHQLDAVFLLEAPLIDFASRARHDQAELMIEATRLQGELVGLDLDRAVSRLYSQFVGAAAAVTAADQSLGLAQKNFDVVKTRVELGAGTELDLARASANLERAKQDKTEFELAQTLYGRQLNTLTGLEPAAVTTFPEDALQAEPPLSQWLGVQNTPSDRLAVKLTEAVDAGKRASNYALLPTLSATAQERLTNATGFAGKAASYTLQGVLTWRLDYATVKQRELADTNIALQQVRTARTRRDMEDQIFTAYQQVQSGIAKSTAARAQVTATKKAADLALERYQAGAATQLDVTQAQREAFLANVSQIQADTDLAYSRLLLRINAGNAMGAEPRQKPAP